MFILWTDVRTISCDMFFWHLWLNKYLLHCCDVLTGWSQLWPSQEGSWVHFSSRSELEKRHIYSHACASAAWKTVESTQKQYVLQTISSEIWRETAIDCQSASLIRGAERAQGLIIRCWVQVDGAGTCWNSSSDGNLIHAPSKHCNQGRHFSRAKCLIHNSSLKITISVETEEGWL